MTKTSGNSMYGASGWEVLSEGSKFTRRQSSDCRYTAVMGHNVRMMGQ